MCVCVSDCDRKCHREVHHLFFSAAEAPAHRGRLYLGFFKIKSKEMIVFCNKFLKLRNTKPLHQILLTEKVTQACNTNNHL